MSGYWSLRAVCSVCSPWALFHCACWHQIAVAGKQKESLFNKGCSKGLNGLQLNIGNITENMRTGNQVRADVQRAVCAASTWPKCFVVSSLSLFLVIASQHLWFICYFLPFFAWWGWYCEVVLEVKHQPSPKSCQYRQWPVAQGERIRSGQVRQSLNSSFVSTANSTAASWRLPKLQVVTLHLAVLNGLFFFPMNLSNHSLNLFKFLAIITACQKQFHNLSTN